MGLLVSRQDDVTIAMPGERLDTATAPEVETELTSLVDGGATRMVVDFSKTGPESFFFLPRTLAAQAQSGQNKLNWRWK